MPDYVREPRKPAAGRRITIILIVVGVLIGWGLFTRHHASAELRDRTEDLAVPQVRVLKAPAGPVTEEIVLPGTVQAWHEAPIYARTNGYVKDWKTDIGAKVKAGDLLAEIETPEVDAQLHQAQADLATAQANNALAQTTAARWKALLKTNSVSRQETDEKVSNALAQAAAVASSRANLERLQQLEDFKRVTAPFDGIITARRIDDGSLINAGSGSTAGGEMFHIAELDKLRIYVQVPETYVGSVTPELKALLHFAEHPDKVFTAELVDTAHALDTTTRTLLVQFSVDNADGALMPGGYTETHLKLPSEGNNVRLPVNTLIFRSAGMQAAVVADDNKAQLRNITIARDFGKEVEVVAGIKPGEMVIVNPPDSLANGEEVRVAKDQAREGGTGYMPGGPPVDGNKARPDDKADDKPKSDDKQDEKKP